MNKDEVTVVDFYIPLAPDESKEDNKKGRTAQNVTGLGSVMLDRRAAATARVSAKIMRSTILLKRHTLSYS